jgi:hypothetical protein
LRHSSPLAHRRTEACCAVSRFYPHYNHLTINNLQIIERLTLRQARASRMRKLAGNTSNPASHTSNPTGRSPNPAERMLNPVRYNLNKLLTN